MNRILLRQSRQTYRVSVDRYDWKSAEGWRRIPYQVDRIYFSSIRAVSWTLPKVEGYSLPVRIALCITAKLQRRGLKWVICRHNGSFASCSLCPRKRASVGALVMTA